MSFLDLLTVVWRISHADEDVAGSFDAPRGFVLLGELLVRKRQSAWRRGERAFQAR